MNASITRDLGLSLAHFSNSSIVDSVFYSPIVCKLDIDYKEEVTIQSLMNHTSGIGDYFEDPVNEGMSIKELLLEKPDHIWTPVELIDFTISNQRTFAKPHTNLHYSDTRYLLLGFIIESITEQSYHDILHEKIFIPLEMNDSYMMFLSMQFLDHQVNLLQGTLMYLRASITMYMMH